MGFWKHFRVVGLAFLDEKLSDFEIVLNEMWWQSGSEWAASRLVWIRHRRDRLQSLMQRDATPAAPDSVAHRTIRVDAGGRVAGLANGVSTPRAAEMRHL